MVTFFPSDPQLPRVFLDASVIIAGVGSKTGASNAILGLCEIGFLRPVVSPHVLNEAERNLTAKLPRALPEYRRLRAKLDWDIQADASDAEVKRWLSIVPPKDAPVLAVAVSSAVRRLLTLDVKDFMNVEIQSKPIPVHICKPGDLLQEMRTIIIKGLV
jgi:predicted nucleic acid-binding protein